MSEIGRTFREHVLSTILPDCSVTQADNDHIVLNCEHARGEVTFYDLGDEFPEVVELRIVDPSYPDDARFFLHFELDNEERAEQLFGEMVEELAEQNSFETRRVLLCCTAGLTTTMFANKLQEAADTLSLDYTFEAIPLAQATAEGGIYDAVLLAPQVGYQRKAVAEAFPDAAVVQIPPKVFASYNTGATLKMVMHMLSDNTIYPAEDEDGLKLKRDFVTKERIMVITCIRRPKNGWTGWRIYDHGEIVAQGSATKRRPTWRDIEDIIATVPMKGWNVSDLDAIGIAVPGVVNQGSVTFSSFSGYGDYELGRKLSEKYGVKVFVDNNANAAAVGCYVSQDTYDSVVLHTQQTGHLVGGQGIVVDGHLLKGRKNYAGQLGPLFAAINGVDEKRNWDLAWTPEGMRRVVVPVLAADVSLVAPDAIYIAVDLLYDMDTVHKDLEAYFGDEAEFIPDLVRVENYRELIALGELALCLQKLHNPRPHRKH